MGTSSTEVVPAKSKIDEYKSWEEEMKAAFDEVDEDHSGDIQPSELMHLMQRVRAPLPARVMHRCAAA
jgi:Ca2+-binding EF-hand superfamily protein